ncbi:hypothetical protein D1174_02290 [Enterobacter cloacae]|nr:hypothetical protein D1177_03420 [Enterobacter cloacae]KAA3580898.1 hypothetical protein D1176_03135 [Enterobacter cloacae]KAA3594160.1 hypothetical protein D1175_03135 [Enterobacter cloacae]KAA3595011.1 hypothetical protein D1174_02290 [Enterobacter cloacae]
MSPLIVTAMVIYAFCAGLVAAKVWRRVNTPNFLLKEKLVITAIRSACCLVSWPFLWMMEERG